MNILLANKFFWLNGGSERVLFQEREFLLSRGHAVADFSMRDPRNLPSPTAGFFVSARDYGSGGGLRDKLRSAAAFVHSGEAVANLSRLVDQERPALAHMHNIYHQLTPSIIRLLRRRGVKTVLTLHDFKLVCPSYLMLRQGAICERCLDGGVRHAFASGCQDSRLKGLLLTAEAYFHSWMKSYEAVDRFIAPSRFVADMVGRRVPRERITVLPNGIDLDEYRPEWRDEGYALYFGRLSREKGVVTLLAAHAGLDRPMPLKIVGTGPLAQELKARHPRAEFLGYKSGAELRGLVAGASFVVVPSEWYENCSMVVLEAMALGKPVLGSRIGGIPEQVEDGITGLLCAMGSQEELARKMAELWGDPERRAAMGRAARQRAEAVFSLRAHCQGLLEIYADVLRN
jgi:glycosyltransferase involved in cell wall biosynthesis